MDIIKKIAVIILAAALCLGSAALAEETPGVTPEDFMGEWVDLDGTCRIEIAEHMAEESVDGYVVNVHMPVIAEESYSYVTWAYGCVWDDETQTLKSISRFMGKGDYEPGSEEEITDSNLDYTAAAFSFDEEGRLAWNDENESADDGLRFVRPIGWGEEYMPAEAAAFEGVWQCDRATIAMDWEEEGFKVLITWGSSAWEHTEWEYSCFYHDEDHTLVSMPFGTRTEVVYDENGEQTSATEVYNDGEAVFSLDEEGKLIWLDEKENAGDGMRFEKLPEEEETYGFYTDEAPEAAAYYSTWVAENGDWRMEVYDEDGGLKLMIVHQLGDNKEDIWEYAAALNPAKDALTTVPLGLHYRQDTVSGSWDETYYEDGDAVFTLNDNGNLLWNDLKEDAGKGLEFMKIGNFFGGRWMKDDIEVIFYAWYDGQYDIRLYRRGENGEILDNAILKGDYDPAADTIQAEGCFDNGELFTVTFSYDESRNVVWTENGESTILKYSYYTD